MIQWKKLKNGMAVLLAVTMVGQPVGVYAEDFTSEAEVESYAEEETDTELETEDGECGEDFSSEDEVETGSDEADETDEISVEDVDSVGDGSSEADADEIEFSDEEVMDEAGTREGSCGENVKYHWDGESTLTISGTGDMYDYNAGYNNNPEWKNFPVEKFVIEDGVTSVGNSVFFKCNTLKEIEIPGVISI